MKCFYLDHSSYSLVAAQRRRSSKSNFWGTDGWHHRGEAEAQDSLSRTGELVLGASSSTPSFSWNCILKHLHETPFIDLVLLLHASSSNRCISTGLFVDRLGWSEFLQSKIETSHSGTSVSFWSHLLWAASWTLGSDHKIDFYMLSFYFMSFGNSFCGKKLWAIDILSERVPFSRNLN